MSAINTVCFLIFFALGLHSLLVQGEGISINPIKEGIVEYDGTGVPFIDDRDRVNIDIQLSCFHSNTRDYAYYLSSRAVITPSITLTGGGHKVNWKADIDEDNEALSPENVFDFIVNPTNSFIPGWFASANPCYRNPSCGRNGTTSSNLLFACTGSECPTDKTIEGEAYWGSAASHGLVRLSIPLSDTMKDAIRADWILKGTQINTSLVYYQTMMPFTGNLRKKILKEYKDSPATARGIYNRYYLKKILGTNFSPYYHTVNYKPSPISWNGTRMFQSVRFAGGNCGKYESPLILYFDSKRPLYLGQLADSFLSEGGLPHFWPEKNSGAYFLSLDRNKNKKIDAAEELFGSNGTGANKSGFEVLKKLDENNDGVISAKDPQFKKLMLWHDANSNGKSEARELTTLEKKGIKSISLKYKFRLTPYGARAQEREHSEFEFIKNGQTVKGAIIDVWFNSLGGQ